MLVHLASAVSALALFSTVGYSLARRIAFRDGRLRFFGMIKLAALLILLPFAVALGVGTATGLDVDLVMAWLPYVFTTIAFFGVMRSRGVDAFRPFGI